MKGRNKELFLSIVVTLGKFFKVIDATAPFRQ